MTMQENDRFDLTPRQIVEYLDRYIVGQVKAKKSVAIALRNRIRRRRLPGDIAKEVAPKNILMVGPTGVGKTEIARRLADLVKAPFVKVEATKFTEVGYVGRDVESIVRDLAEAAVAMVKKRKIEDVQVPAAERAEQRLADALLPRPEKKSAVPDFMRLFGGGGSPEKERDRDESPEEERLRDSTRRKILALLREGKLDDREVEIDVTESQSVGIPLLGGAGMDSMGINIGDMLGGMLPKKTKRRRMKVSEARTLLAAEEAEKLVDMDAVVREALDKAQEEGIVFLDEIDKVVARGGTGGPDVSREGVQRITDRYREGRIAMNRMARELQSAYLSEHLPLSPALQVTRTAFIADPGSPADRLDFNSLAYQRLDRDSKESDQMEVSYFGSRDPNRRGVVDLVRRVSPLLDDKPEQGGRVEVLATDIDLFDLKYLDPLTGMWRDEWDSTSAMREAGRLPLQVHITLVLNEGMRAGSTRRSTPHICFKPWPVTSTRRQLRSSVLSPMRWRPRPLSSRTTHRLYRRRRPSWAWTPRAVAHTSTRWPGKRTSGKFPENFCDWAASQLSSFICTACCTAG